MPGRDGTADRYLSFPTVLFCTSLTFVGLGGGSQAMQGAMTVAIWWASISL